MSLIKTFIPPLKESMHKGQAGKIAVIGGCTEYTGINYYHKKNKPILIHIKRSTLLCWNVCSQNRKILQ